MADIEKIERIREHVEKHKDRERAMFTVAGVRALLDELSRLRTRVAELEANGTISDFGQKLIASQTAVEPEFAEALYSNRAEQYRIFDLGAVRICPMRDGPCPHGLACPYVGDDYMGYPCKEGWSGRRALSERKEGQTE